MKKFIVRRVLLGAMILFFVSMIIYSIERALPTSYVEGRARDMSMKQGAKPYDELVAELMPLMDWISRSWKVISSGLEKLFMVNSENPGFSISQ